MTKQKYNSVHQKRNNNSTNMQLLQLSMWMLSIVSHHLSAKLAWWLWFSSPKFKQPKREADWQRSSRVSFLDHQYGPIALYEWGNKSAATILLVHGWSGRGPQLGAFGVDLAKRGFHVVAFDAPGHGQSAANNTTIFKIESVLQAISQQFGPIDTVIAHSFGVLVTALAIKNGLSLNKLVCISSPTSAEFLFDQFCQALAIHDKTRRILLEMFKHRFGADLWEKLSASHNLLNSDLPVLIVHDKNDAIVPPIWSERLHSVIPNSKLLLTEGLGHRRILRHNETLNQVNDFIQSTN